MTKKQFVNSKGDTWEWEETEEMRKAVERLHADIRKLEAEAPDYGVGKMKFEVTLKDYQEAGEEF